MLDQEVPGAAVRDAAHSFALSSDRIVPQLPKSAVCKIPHYTEKRKGAARFEVHAEHRRANPGSCL
jgi:hypothetical protein